MKNIDIDEWLLNNNIDPNTEIVADGKQWFLSDILEKHLKEQFAIHSVSGSFSAKDMQNFAAKCMILGNDGKDTPELLKDFCNNDR